VIKPPSLDARLLLGWTELGSPAQAWPPSRGGLLLGVWPSLEGPIGIGAGPRS